MVVDSSRFTGWTFNYLKKIKAPEEPTFLKNSLTIRSYMPVVGIKKRLAHILLIFNEYNQFTSWKSSACFFRPFEINNNFFKHFYYVENCNATILKYFSWIRLFATRSRRARMTAILQPAHGQSHWHNANTVRFCNQFLAQFCRSLENDLYKLHKRKRIRFTKLMEIRAKARVKQKVKKKKSKKFKKFGERRLAMKKKKKSVWA